MMETEEVMAHWVEHTQAAMSALRVLRVQQAQTRADIDATVRTARSNNVTWSAIATGLGISKQAAQQRYRRH